MVAEYMRARFKNPDKGLSEPVALAILFGIAIALSTSFLVYMQASYSIQQNFTVIQRAVEHERLNTVVRLINSSKGLTALLFRKLDNGNRVAFFIFNGSSYTNCSTLVRNVVGGRIVGRYSHRVEDISAVSRDMIYNFRYYARASGYPDTGTVDVCVLEIDKNNAVTVMQFVQEPKPVAEGYKKTVVNSNNRRWRMYGTIEFRVEYLGNPSGVHLSINGTWYQLRAGDVIRVNVDTTIGKIDLTPEVLPTGRLGAWILSFNVSARSVYVNNALLAGNANVEIKSDVAIDIDSVKSSLAIEILPEPPGFVRVKHGDTTLVDYWNNSDYIRVVEWRIDSSTQMVLQLDSTNLHAEGIARAVYIGPPPSQIQIDRLSIFIVTYINNVPHLVGTYEYKFS